MKTYDRDTKTHNFYSGERYGLLLFLEMYMYQLNTVEIRWIFCEISHPSLNIIIDLSAE